MSHLWIDPSACPTLAVLVESVTAPLLMEHDSAVCLELDVDLDLTIPADPHRTADLIKALTLQALEEMPEGGDLTFTGCRTTAGIELEIADSGADLDTRPRLIPMTAASIGVQIEWQNCQQGGAAATIIFPVHWQQPRKVA